MTAKKHQYWFHILEISAQEITYSLCNHKKIDVTSMGGAKGYSKGRFTFQVDEQGLEDVTFQVTAHNKLGIYVPYGLDVTEVILLFKPILEEAVGKSVKLKPYSSEQASQKKVNLYEPNLEMNSVPDFLLSRFHEEISKPIKSSWSIRILNPNKTIEKCSVKLDGVLLPWWDSLDELVYEKRIYTSDGGNVRVPLGLEEKANAEVVVYSRGSIIKKEKFIDLELEKA